MLVICTKTGLTYARKLYREGDVFILSGAIEREYKDLSDDAWRRKQKKTYSGEVVFRKPTSEELIQAIKDKKLDPGSASVRGHLSKRQLRIALDFAESKEMKKITGIRMLKEGLDMDIEDAPEEKAEVVEAPREKEVKTPEKDTEAPKEEVVEAPEKDAEAPKEETEGEEVAEASKEEVEAPEEEVEAPPEEPKPESTKPSTKKEKKK